MVVVCLFFEKMSKLCFSFSCYYLFLWILLFKIFIVGICLVKNGIAMILCLISVMWKVCLNGLLMSLFCSIVRVGTRKGVILIEIVFFVSLSLSVDSQFMWFNCNSVLSLFSIPGGSGWVSSVDCTRFICLWCLGVLQL